MTGENNLFGSTGSTHCMRCGRRLTDPKSVRRGIGPICAQQVGLSPGGDGARERQYADEFLSYEVPMLQEVVLERHGDPRQAGGVATNVPHLVCHHSPSGYEFGYGGSGPADLALNICERYVRAMQLDGKLPTRFGEKKVQCYEGTCDPLSWRLHQQFKRQFIAPVDREEGKRIPARKIYDWIKGEAAEHLSTSEEYQAGREAYQAGEAPGEGDHLDGWLDAEFEEIEGIVRQESTDGAGEEGGSYE